MSATRGEATSGAEAAPMAAARAEATSEAAGAAMAAATAGRIVTVSRLGPSRAESRYGR